MKKCNFIIKKSSLTMHFFDNIFEQNALLIFHYQFHQKE